MKIAVITPCYNNENFIGDCLSSVARTIHFKSFEFEHIVIDDGSTDNSWKIIENFSGAHLKKIHFSKNEGQGKARNKAVSQTDADFLFFLDSDDVIFQNSLRTLAIFLKNKTHNWVYFDFLTTSEELNYQIGSDYYGWSFSTNKEVLQSMYKGEHFFQGNCLVTRESFLAVGGYDESVKRATDFDLYTRYLLRGFCPVYLPAPLYLHRFHQGNMSNIHKKDPTLHQKDVITFYEKYQKELGSLGIREPGAS